MYLEFQDLKILHTNFFVEHRHRNLDSNVQREKAERTVASREALAALRAIQTSSIRALEAPPSSFGMWPLVDNHMATGQIPANKRQKCIALHHSANKQPDPAPPDIAANDAIPRL